MAAGQLASRRTPRAGPTRRWRRGRAAHGADRRPVAGERAAASVYAGRRLGANADRWAARWSPPGAVTRSRSQATRAAPNPSSATSAAALDRQGRAPGGRHEPRRRRVRGQPQRDRATGCGVVRERDEAPCRPQQRTRRDVGMAGRRRLGDAGARGQPGVEPPAPVGRPVRVGQAGEEQLDRVGADDRIPVPAPGDDERRVARSVHRDDPAARGGGQRGAPLRQRAVAQRQLQRLPGRERAPGLDELQDRRGRGRRPVHDGRPQVRRHLGDRDIGGARDPGPTAARQVRRGAVPERRPQVEAARRPGTRRRQEDQPRVGPGAVEPLARERGRQAGSRPHHVRVEPSGDQRAAGRGPASRRSRPGGSARQARRRARSPPGRRGARTRAARRSPPPTTDRSRRGRRGPGARPFPRARPGRGRAAAWPRSRRRHRTASRAAPGRTARARTRPARRRSSTRRRSRPPRDPGSTTPGAGRGRRSARGSNWADEAPYSWTITGRPAPAASATSNAAACVVRGLSRPSGKRAGW